MKSPPCKKVAIYRPMIRNPTLCMVTAALYIQQQNRMEVCIDLVESAVNAESGGASRVELCSNLAEGGTTPSLGLLRIVKRKVNIPVYVMIRPRGGDFAYSEDEFDVMREDIIVLKESGADGFVFGILTQAGSIDRERNNELLELAKPLPVTFHRAFDMVRDPFQALDTLASMGFSRVLTSGLDSTALEGLPLIKQLVIHAKGRITIVPGGGITERNLERIVQGSGAVEFHCSARSSRESIMSYRNTHVSMGASYGPPEFSTKIADSERIEALLAIAKTAWSEIP